MSCITVRGCAIGQGRPKVILPIVEETQSAILARGRAFAALAADCVEFRADWFEGWQDAAALAQTPGVGPRLAGEIYAWFRREEN